MIGGLAPSPRLLLPGDPGFVSPLFPLSVRRRVDAARFWATISDRKLARLLREEIGATGDILSTYAAASTLTQTGLDGITSSPTWIAGWGSATIDNSSVKYTDYAVNAVLQAESAGLTAGQARLYLVPELNDSAYPDCLSSGTEGAEGAVTMHDVATRDAVAFLLAWTDTDTTASQFYYLMCPSIRQVLGYVPRKFFLFITHSMVAALETTGDPNQVYVAGRYDNVAA